MESLVTLIGLAIVVFASTNIDDVFVLVAFFADKNPQPRLSDLRGDRAQVRVNPQAHHRGDRCTANPAGTCAAGRSPLR